MLNHNSLKYCNSISIKMPKNLTSLSPARLEALVDGVFAIAMTLLVFDLKVPQLATTVSTAEFTAHLFALWPNFLGYAISFIILGSYWVAQHNAFNYIKFADRTFLWINLFFLAAVAFVPFSTSLLARYPEQQTAHLLYGLNLMFIGLVRFVSWHYATVHHRLVDHKIGEKLVRIVKKRILFGPIVCLIAITASFANTLISLLLYLLIPLYFMVPADIDKFWHRPAKEHTH